MRLFLLTRSSLYHHWKYKYEQVFRTYSTLHHKSVVYCSGKQVKTHFYIPKYMPNCALLSQVYSMDIDAKFMTTLSVCQKMCDKKDAEKDQRTPHQKDDELLKKDRELRSILNEIMKDFSTDESALKKDEPKADSSGTAPKQKKSSMPPNTRFFHTSTNYSKRSNDMHDKNGCDEQTNNSEGTNVTGKEELPWSVKERFESFDKSGAEVVLDVEEQRALELQMEEAEEDYEEIYLHQEKHDELTGLSFERGKTGVFDMEELVPILREEKLEDIAVIKVPEEFHYCNYMIVATALSPRHCKAVTEFLCKLHKRKKHKKDPFIIIEGQNVYDWRVLDMGNIVLHVFLQESRNYYDIESLWTLGCEFDEITNKKQFDPYQDLLDQHMHVLRQMQPLIDVHTENRVRK